MAGNAIRTMTLNVGTVSVPVALKSTTERKLPSFSTASPEGHKYKPYNGEDLGGLVETQEDAVAVAEELGVPVESITTAETKYRDEVTGAIFGESEIERGVWEGEQFFAISGEDIEKIDDQLRQPDLTIQEFVDLADVPWERVTGGYFLSPSNKTGVGLKALNLIREAMEVTQTAGVVLLMPKSRVKLAVVYPKHGGLLVSVLSYADEWAQVRSGAAALSDPRGEPTEQELAYAVTLIDAYKGDGELLDGIKDLQAEMKAELIERAKAGQPVDAVDLVVGPDGRTETTLEQALRMSIEAAKKAKEAANPKPKRKAPAKTAGKTSRAKRPAATPGKARV